VLKYRMLAGGDREKEDKNHQKYDASSAAGGGEG
jgi:hypothetical protein